MLNSEIRSVFQIFCRDISVHLKKSGVANVSEATVKELVLLTLGNTVDLLGTKVAMRSSKYKSFDKELTAHDNKNEFISMNELIIKMQAWASADLNLELKTPTEGETNANRI